MHPCTPIRALLYSLLFATSAVLLGLTAYRIHYTRGLTNGDILTTRSHFYDPVVVLLLVSACLGLLFSLVVIPFLFTGRGSTVGRFVEHILMWPLWIMLLVGAAYFTSKFSSLRFCRHSFRVCRILETIKAFSWICWGLLTLALIAGLVHMFTNKGSTRRDDDGYRSGTYPETRQTYAETNPTNTNTTTGTHPTTTQTTVLNTTHTRPVGVTDPNVHNAAVA